MKNTLSPTIPQVHVVGPLKMIRVTKRQKYNVNGSERRKAEKTEAVRVGYQWSSHLPSRPQEFLDQVSGNRVEEEPNEEEEEQQSQSLQDQPAVVVPNEVPYGLQRIHKPHQTGVWTTFSKTGMGVGMEEMNRKGQAEERAVTGGRKDVKKESGSIRKGRQPFQRGILTFQRMLLT